MFTQTKHTRNHKKSTNKKTTTKKQTNKHDLLPRQAPTASSGDNLAKVSFILLIAFIEASLDNHESK